MRIDRKFLSGLPWSKENMINTDLGPRLYKVALVAKAFESEIEKAVHVLKTMAITIKRHEGRMYLYSWQIPEHERDRAAIESRRMSTAIDNDSHIPVPDGLKLDGYQIAGVEYILGRRGTLLADEMGLGKWLGVNNLGLTPSGWRKMGDLKVGDQIIGSTGKAINITGVFPQGVKPLYRVRFSDGSSVTAGADHLWGVDYRCGGRRWVRLTLTTEQIMNRPKTGTLDLSKTVLYLPMLSGPVEFKANAVPIDPYLLGQLIANGSLTESTPMLTTNNNDWGEVLDRVSIFSRGNPRQSPGCVKNSFLGIASVIRGLGLNVLSGEKFIPRIYLESSPSNRIELLHGLMDADGSISKTRSKVTYHTTSFKLANDVVELIEGLGGIASIRTYDRTHEGKPIEYQVRLRLPEWVKPFTISRKALRYNPGSHALPVRTFESVEYSHDEESVCIAVDAPDRLYVTEHCILTHNTVQAIAAINAINHRAGKKKINRALVVCPADLRLNWRDELNRWLVDRYSVDIIQGDTMVIADITIVSYESLHKYQHLLDAHWDLVIADEVHYLCNPNARRTKAVVGYKPKKKDDKEAFQAGLFSARKIAMSGTPMQDKPADIFTIANWLDPVSFPNRSKFIWRYCGGADTGVYSDRGCSNPRELNELLRETIMVRREKKDVLKDLPPKRRSVHVIPAAAADLSKVKLLMNSGKMAQWMVKFIAAKATLELSRGMSDLMFSIADTAYRDVIGEAAGASFELFHAIGLAKVEPALEIFRRTASETCKFVIFVHHQDVMDRVCAEFPKCIRISGSVDMGDRHAAVKRFRDDPSCGPAVVGIDCAKGIDMTVASIEYFLESSWLISRVMQAEDRCHRRGQKACVMVTHLVLEGSIDITRANSTLQKQMAIDQMVNMNPDAEYEERDPIVPIPGITLDRTIVLRDVSKYSIDAINGMLAELRTAKLDRVETEIVRQAGLLVDRSKIGPVLAAIIQAARHQTGFPVR